MSMTDSVPFVEWTRPGQYVAGEIVEIRKGRRFPGRQSFVAEIERKDGSTAALALSRVLDAMFREESVRAGDRVKITYIGIKRAKNGRKYRAFTIERRPA